MKITNEFTVHTPVDHAWAVLTDLEGIAPCLPGAQVTGVDGDVYSGKVKVKVGPVISDFSGTARFVEKDDGAHRAVIDAKGRDARAGGNASALITASLKPDGDATIEEVSSKLLGQFVESLEAKIGSGDAPAEAPSAPSSAPIAEGTVAAAVDAPAIKPAEAAFETGRPPVPATIETGGPAAAVDTGAGGSAAAVRAGAGGSAPAMGAEEPAPLDLMELAGGSLRKRLLPLVAGAVVIAAVVIWRRRRR
jgi:carbon monoxide dehydrogenase subunit G